MNFFTFFLTQTLVERKTKDRNLANRVALAASFVPGTQGLMMGVLLANNEPAPKKDTDGIGKDQNVAVERRPHPQRS